jgi:hypothetical protein
MCKFSLSNEQRMSVSIHLEDARKKSSWLVSREARGPGDLDNAMRRIERRHGVPYATLWALRYRKGQDIFVSVYTRIWEAYEAECERQRILLDHEISINRAKTRFGETIVRAGAALAGTESEVDR